MPKPCRLGAPKGNPFGPEEDLAPKKKEKPRQAEAELAFQSTLVLWQAI